MGPIGRWLVPLFLLVLGLSLALDAYYLSINAQTNYSIEQQSVNNKCDSQFPHPSPCVTLSSCQEECGLADLTAWLAGITLIAGVWMTGVRGWRYWTERKARPRIRA